MSHHIYSKEFISIINQKFDKIPYNRLLGIKVESIGHDGVKTFFEMRDDLMGNYDRGMLHGGVISSAIDVTGGLAAIISIQERMHGDDIEKKIETSYWISTIDLRVDFLRPGIGSRFVVSAYVLRTGKKIAVTRIELHNEKDELIAAGTGAYIFGK